MAKRKTPQCGALHNQPLLWNYLSSSGRDSRPPRTGYLSSLLVSLFSLHVSRFQTVSPSPLSKWEEEEELFDMRIVRVGDGLSLGACGHWNYCGWKSRVLQQPSLTHTNAAAQRMDQRDQALEAKLNISSTHCLQPNDKKGSELMRRNMRREAPSIPTAAYGPRLLREQETPLVISKTWFLGQEIPAVVSSESETRRKYGPEKSECTTRESSRRKVWHNAWTQDKDGQSLAGDGTFWKSRSLGKATSKRWLKLPGRRLNGQYS